MKQELMKNYQPYSLMGTSCKIRQIRDKKVIWPYVDEYIFNDRFRGKIISIDEIDKAAELWRSSYPEIFGSSAKYEWLLFPDEYAGKVAMRENWEHDAVHREFCMPVVEDLDTNQFVSGALYTKDDQNLQVEFSFGAIHPAYRKGISGNKLVEAALSYLKLLEEKSGAEYLNAFCETWHSISQFLCLKIWGWKLAGIFPGQYTRWCGENQEYRGCTVHFYKLVGDAEKYTTKPDEWKLLPEVKKIWEALEEINLHANATDHMK